MTDPERFIRLGGLGLLAVLLTCYVAAYPDCNWFNADCDNDAFVSLIGS